MAMTCRSATARARRLTLDHAVLDAAARPAARGRRPTPSPRSSTRCPATPARSAGAMGDNIEQRRADGARAASSAGRAAAADADPSTPLGPTLEGAYALGRGEARSGRSDGRAARGLPGRRPGGLARAGRDGGRGRACRPTTLAQFAELVFAYIDELSAASVAGHTDELATTGRVRQRYLERLGQHLLARRRRRRADRRGRARRLDAADDADRRAAARARRCAPVLGARSAPAPCSVGEDLPGSSRRPDEPLVAAARARRRRAGPRATLLRALAGRTAVVGPAAPVARRSARRTTGRCAPLRPGRPTRRARPVDTEEHLAELVLAADPRGARRPARPGARAARRPARRRPREKLAETLRVLAAAPGPPRRRRRRAVRAPADGALPDGPAARAVRRPARRPGGGARARHRTVRLVIDAGVTTQPAVTGARAGRAGRASRGRVRHTGPASPSPSCSRTPCQLWRRWPRVAT